MPGKDNRNGGNGGGGAKPIPTDPPEVRKKKLYSNRRFQYFLLQLAKILNYEPHEKPIKNVAFVMEMDGFFYDMGEIFEKAVKALEGK